MPKKLRSITFCQVPACYAAVPNYSGLTSMPRGANLSGKRPEARHVAQWLASNGPLAWQGKPLLQPLRLLQVISQVRPKLS